MNEHEQEIVDEIAETFMRFCMPRETWCHSEVVAREVYDTLLRPRLRDVWAAGRRAHHTDPNPYGD